MDNDGGDPVDYLINEILGEMVSSLNQESEISKLISLIEQAVVKYDKSGEESETMEVYEEGPPEEIEPDKIGLIFEIPGRGRKQCPTCTKYIGVRSQRCPGCNHTFER